MISALLFAAAAGNFVPPTFTPEEDRQAQQQATQGGQSAAAVIDARVDPKGKLSDCKAISTSGDAKVAAGICTHLDGVVILPASVSGVASYGVVRHLIGTPAAGTPLSDPSDVELQVNRLPAGQTTLRVAANVLIDTAGKPQACYATGDAPQAYADVTCTQVSALGFGSINDNDGKPVQYVRTVIVEFKLPAGAAPAAGG